MALYFSTFEAAVRAHTYPEGESENLIPNHRRYIADALIDLQMKIPCLQEWHVDYIPACGTYWFCGATVFQAPRGEIFKVQTIGGSYNCERVEYQPISKEDFDCLAHDNSFCATLSAPYESYYSGGFGYYVPYPALPMEGFQFPNAQMDKVGRSMAGFVALWQGNLYLYPSLQSDETVEVEWAGIKRSWNDGDLVNSFDREVERAVELYLESESHRKEDCNFEKFTTASASYNLKVSDMIYRCKKERRLKRRAACFASAFGRDFVNIGAVFLPTAVTSGAAATTTVTQSVREIYAGVSPPSVPDDPTRPAIFIPDDGTAWLRWSVSGQSWG